MTTPVKIDYDLIREELATSNKSIAIICKEQGWNYNTVLSQICRDSSVDAMITRARQDQANHIVGEMLSDINAVSNTILDPDMDGATKHALTSVLKTKMDTVKWIACKYYPRVYGDRIQLDTGISVNIDKFRSMFTPDKIDNNANNPQVIECKEVKTLDNIT